MLMLASEGLYSSGGSRCDLSRVRIFMRIFMSELIFNHFRYMKFIYLHCGEEMNLRDLCS